VRLLPRSPCPRVATDALCRHKTLHLSALGAAIPLLATLAASLPDALPYAPGRLRTELRTGTVLCQDELVPDDEDADVAYETRGKSSLMVTIMLDGGDPEPEDAPPVAPQAAAPKTQQAAAPKTQQAATAKMPQNMQQPAAPAAKKGKKGKGAGAPAAPPRRIVVEEPEQDEMDVV
jgi:hypothetical protein